ncbi:hypothetical protein CRG98_043696 [Punica granatum]|uniref:Uncharacterized protein n=1 Tax=Punica granatum TaxID=22663 RepID=A0A2I0HW51_PUNGR|nr:hypothetical protein CRG98_043696 [Punica granatum]
MNSAPGLGWGSSHGEPVGQNGVLTRATRPFSVFLSSYRRFGGEHVYPVPLDPGNLSALDLRVVKWQEATPSHVHPSRIPGKVDTPKPCLLRRVHECPDEIKFRPKPVESSKVTRPNPVESSKVTRPKPVESGKVDAKPVDAKSGKQ